MAEEKITEKVYCYDHPSAYKNDNALIGAIMSKGNDCNRNAMWDNPFAYLIWMMLLRNWNGDGYGASSAMAENFNSRQIASVQETLNNNQNSNLIMDAVKGNANAISALANKLNCDFNTLNTAVCGVRSAVENVGGKIGLTGEKVINSVLLGNKDLLQTIQSCCCENKLLVTQQGYENRLAMKDMQNAFTSRIDQLANGITQGFSATSYEAQRHTNDIIQSGNANTQRIVDTLNAHWQQETQSALQDEKFQNSQLKQNIYIRDLIERNATTPTA